MISAAHPAGIVHNFVTPPNEFLELFAGKEFTCPLWKVWTIENWGIIRDVKKTDGEGLNRPSANEVQLFF